MAHQIKLTPRKTYKTVDNAVKAVEDKLGPNEAHFGSASAHYLIAVGDDGRYFPVFFGEKALQRGLHFHFCVVSV